MFYVECLLLLAFTVSLNCRLGLRDVVDEEWQLFKAQHSKVYSSSFEDHFRKEIYRRNKLKIIQHNKLYELGQTSFKLGLNKFTDLDHHEFLSKVNCGINGSSINVDYFMSEANTFIGPDNDVSLPPTIDWRDKGAVTRVKDQGDCGSCWAFAATGTVEGQFFRTTGKLVPLSEQNLIDCDRYNGNWGCKGGFPIFAFKYIQINHGIDTEISYPYEGERGRCRYIRKHRSGASVEGFCRIPARNEQELMKAVATVGPISVIIDASSDLFEFYKEGVYYDRACSSTSGNHAVLVVGYGTTRNREDYWIVKNSWGHDWGDNGYVLMARNRQNHCGIANHASYPRVSVL